MRCPGCQRDNAIDARFCGGCGLPLAVPCPTCGHANAPDNRFCSGCGAPLPPRPPAQRAEPIESLPFGDAGAGAERRQLTVMFCDLVGSTELSARLDPEILREVIRSYQHASEQVIDRFRGHVAQHLGDGLLVYFGYPAAHEDAPQRAVRAALGILAAMKILNGRLERERHLALAVRIGIHTGPVVVGEIGGRGRREELALGETPNVAARLQALAEPDSVVISAMTQRLTRAHFRCGDLGPHAIKGLPAPLIAYRVEAELSLPDPLGPPVGDARTPLVGREEEIAFLLGRWEHVTDGFGQVVLLSGEPGIGKSRVVRALREHVATQAHVRWECRCSAYHQDSALHPVVELFERVLGFERDDTAAGRFGKIETALARRGLAQPESARLWAALLSVPVPDHHPPLSLTPQRQKQRTFESIVELLMALTAEQPVLLIVEDLHWADPSTRELLDLIVEQVSTAPVLILLTFRPEFRPPWGPRAHVTHLVINRFTRRQTELMVERVTGGKKLPPDVLQQVVTKTDGVPLFVEELTKMIVESGLVREADDRYELRGVLPPLAIPSTLQDSLMARLDRLAAVKEVAQIGAALGRTFTHELLRAVTLMDGATVDRALARLVEAELLYQRGVPPDASYIFKHALIQETARESMLLSRRKQLHQTIADTLLERFPHIATTQPELVAHHYTEAGLPAQAVTHWRRAGQRALEHSANLEAIAHLRRGLAVLEGGPDDAERRQRELDLQTALGPALMATKGFGSVEVAEVYARARQLCHQLGDTTQLFDVLRGLWEYYELRAEAGTGLELAREILQLAERAHDTTLLVIAHDVMQDTSLWLGDYAATRWHMQRALALYDPAQHRSLAFRHGGYDPAMACHAFGGHALWYLGYADQALAHHAESLRHARELAHPPTLVFALSHAAVLHQFRGEAPLARARADEALQLADEQGFEFWRAHATISRGWALAREGAADEGVALILEALAGYRATGAELERSLWVALLADGYGRAGRPHDGLAAIDEALVDADRTGVRFHEAELHRLKGELLLTLPAPSPEAAATSFLQALALARRRNAKSLELRAAMSLSRLWARQGKREDARRLLSEIHGWFTEGLDTPDLEEAQALLDELTNR